VLLHLRAAAVRAKGAAAERAAMRAAAWTFGEGRRLALAQRLGRIAQRPFLRAGVVRRLPPPLAAWTKSRDLKPIARESFRDWWAGRP
jgi:L-lactate dehydrogenase complex protein LldF